jgi:hypothetical protein
MQNKNIRKPKCVVSKAPEYTHWIEMKVKLRRNREELVRRKAQLQEKLSKMNVNSK